MDLRETTYFGRFTVTYDRDPDGALRISTPEGGAHRIRRDEHGTILATLGNGTRVLAAYDEEGRCLGRAAWRPRGGTHRALVGALHCTRPRASSAGSTTPPAASTDYSYDAARRVIGESGPNGRKAAIVIDAAGNIREKPGLADVDAARRQPPRRGRERALPLRRAQPPRRAGGRQRRDRRAIATTASTCWSGCRGASGPRSGRPPTTAWAGGSTRRSARSAPSIYWDGDRLAAEVGPTGALRLYVYAGPEALVPLLFIDYDSVDADPASGRIYYPVGNQLGVPLHIEDAEGKVVWWAEHVEPYGAVTVRPGASSRLCAAFSGALFR